MSPYRPPIHRPFPAAPKPQRKPDERESAAARGYGHRWRKIRTMHLAEHPLCVDCEARGLVVEATHVDHVIARAKGGTDDDTNLQSLCTPCHSRKTALVDGGFGRKPKELP